MPVRALFITFLSILLITAVTGIINYRKKYRPMLFLVLLLVYTFISEGTAFWAGIVLKNDRFVYPIYDIVSTTFYTVFFYDVIIDEKIRKTILIIGALIVALAILNIVFFDAFNTGSDRILKIQTGYLFLAGSMLLFQQIDIPGDRPIFKDPVFLAGLTLVWYTVITSLPFFFRDLLATYKLKLRLLNYLTFFSNYIHYSIFFLAMLHLKNYKNYAR